MTEQNSSLSRSWQRLPLDGQVGVLPYALVIEVGAVCALCSSGPARPEVKYTPAATGRSSMSGMRKGALATGVQPG